MVGSGSEWTGERMVMHCSAVSGRCDRAVGELGGGFVQYLGRGSGMDA